MYDGTRSIRNFAPERTVSRALSDLHGKGILGFLGQTQRQIVILDRVRLAELDL